MHQKQRESRRGPENPGRRTGRKLSQAARWLVIGGTLLSPWLFGCAEGWSYFFLSILFHVGTMLWLTSLLLNPPQRAAVRKLSLPLLSLSVFVVIQMIPMPSSIAGAVSPESSSLHAAACATVKTVRLETGSEQGAEATCRGMSISVSPTQTLRSFFLMTAYVGAFLVMASWEGHRREIRRVAAVFALAGFLMSMFALLQASSGAREIYGFHSPRHGGNFFGTFSNRNHFAFHMNLLFGMGMGLMLSGRTAYGFWGLEGWRKRVAWLSTSEGSRMLWNGLTVIVMGSAVCLSLSRGGIASLLGGLTLVGVMFGARGRSFKRSRAAFAVVLLLLLCSVVWLGWDSVVSRIGTLSDVARDPVGDTRFKATVDTLRCFARFPIAGAGLGCFQHAFPLVQSAPLQFGRWLHAHNDWAELLADIGIVGFGLVIWALVCLFGLIRERYRKAEHDSRLFINGLLVGIFAAVLHSALDYSLHKPANAALLAVLIGLTVAAAGERSASRGHHRTLLPRRLTRGSRVIVSFLILTFAAMILLECRSLESEVAFARYYRVGRLVERLTDRSEISGAAEEALAEGGVVVDALVKSPDALLEVAVSNARWLRYRLIKPVVRIQLAEQAVDAASGASIAAPSNYLHWLWWARTESFMGRREEAEVIMARARELAPPGVDPALR